MGFYFVRFKLPFIAQQYFECTHGGVAGNQRLTGSPEEPPAD
jgi:hypothetical protein